MDIHATIQRFLQQQTIAPLAGSAPAGANSCIKAGIVPFTRGCDYRYFLMKPVAKRPGLGAPAFQLCKGTRMYKAASGWQDMQADEKAAGEMETLATTAIREGIEELGLIVANIAQLLDVGPYDFSSTATGKGKKMWLFAAEMAKEEFLLREEVAPTTADRGWLTLAEFEKAGREDHRSILRDIEKKLYAHYKG